MLLCFYECCVRSFPSYDIPKKLLVHLLRSTVPLEGYDSIVVPHDGKGAYHMVSGVVFYFVTDFKRIHLVLQIC